MLPTFLRAQDWLPAAEADIRAHRMAPLRVTLVGTVPANTTVRVRQTESEYIWGTTVNVERALNLATDGVGVGGDDPYYLHLLDFNSVTPENAGKWKLWERPTLRAYYGEVAAWLRGQGVQNRGHGTIWPSIRRWNAVPADVLVLTDSLNAQGQVVIKKNDRIRARVKAHIESYVRTMSAWGVYELDLVNELVHEGDLTTDVMGLNRAESITGYAQWYKWAAAADPEVKLVANEYDLFQSGNNFHTNFVAFVRDMLAQGAPIASVGMQGHFFGAVPSYGELRKRLDEVAALGLPMTVTEFDMDGNDAAAMDRVMYAVFAHPKVYGFTMWGAWDGKQWRGNTPVYNRDWSVKPSGTKYFELANERWRTDTAYQASGAASRSLLAFRGEYVVSVTTPTGVFVRTVSVGSNGGTVAVDLSATPAALPTATLTTNVAGGTVLRGQPVLAKAAANTAIEKIEYFIDGVRVAVRAGSTPDYLFEVVGRGSQTLSAHVHLENGLLLEPAPVTYTIDASNRAPQIRSVLPASGAIYLKRDGIRVEVRATDGDGDALAVSVVGAGGDVISRDTEAPFVFNLDGLSVGQNDLRILVEDTRFGRAEQAYVLNLVDGAGVVQSISAPLTQDDDIEERPNGSIDVTGDLDIGQYLMGIRFLPRLPAGARVESAYVQFVNQKDDQTGDMNISIEAELSARPARLSSASGNVSARPRTAASVPWSVSAPWLNLGDVGTLQRTPSLVPVVVELVAQSGFDEESAVVLLLDVDAEGDKRSGFSVDLSEEFAPRLVVEYGIDTQAERGRLTSASFSSASAKTGTLSWEVSGVTAAQPLYEITFEPALPARVVSERSVLLEGLSPDTDYVATITLVGVLGQQADVLVYPFKTLTSGVNSYATAKPLRLSPNPVVDVLYVEGERLEGLVIRDMSGRHIATAKTIAERLPTGRYEITTTHLAAGTYLVEGLGEGRIQTALFVKF